MSCRAATGVAKVLTGSALTQDDFSTALEIRGAGGWRRGRPPYGVSESRPLRARGHRREHRNHGAGVTLPGGQDQPAHAYDLTNGRRGPKGARSPKRPGQPRNDGAGAGSIPSRRARLPNKQGLNLKFTGRKPMLRRTLLGIAGAAVVTAGLGTAAQAQEPVKIGLILPMTGPVRLDRQADRSGRQALHAAERRHGGAARRSSSSSRTTPASPT